MSKKRPTIFITKERQLELICWWRNEREVRQRSKGGEDQRPPLSDEDHQCVRHIGYALLTEQMTSAQLDRLDVENTL